MLPNTTSRSSNGDGNLLLTIVPLFAARSDQTGHLFYGRIVSYLENGCGKIAIMENYDKSDLRCAYAKIATDSRR